MKFGALTAVVLVSLAVAMFWMGVVQSRKISACEARNGIPLFTRSGNYRACAAALITWGE